MIAQAQAEDVAIGISTSGGSQNIIMALEEARKRNLLTVALLASIITSSANWWRYWAVAKLELYGTTRCPYRQEMRDWLKWQRRDFVEYNVDADREDRRRLSELAGGQRNVPVLIEDNKVIQIGWQGRSCMVEAE